MVYIVGNNKRVKKVCDTQEELQRELMFVRADEKVQVVEIADKYLLIITRQ